MNPRLSLEYLHNFICNAQAVITDCRITSPVHLFCLTKLQNMTVKENFSFLNRHNFLLYGVT
jgi:hypothetical protein